MAGFVDREGLRFRLAKILHSHGIALNKNPDEMPAGMLDSMIDEVVDAHAQAAVSKGMEFARGLLAKRGGKEGGE